MGELEKNSSSSSEGSESGWAGEKVVKKSKITSKKNEKPTHQSKINSPKSLTSNPNTPTKITNTHKLEASIVNLKTNKDISSMKQDQFFDLIKMLYGLCRGDENESQLYQALSEMCNLIVDMGNITMNESISNGSTFSQSVNKKLEEQKSSENVGVGENSPITENSQTNHNQNQGIPKSQSCTSIIKAQLQAQNRHKDKWRVTIVQFLAAIHSDETLNSWFSRPRCLFNKRLGC